MAKIILKVGAELEKTAESGFGKVKSQIDALAKSLNNVKANKEFTEQLKALTQWNKSLADAVKKTTDVTNKKALADEKLAQQQAKTAKETAKYYQEEEKLNREKIKSAEATGKVLVQEEKVEQAKIKTAIAEKKLAGAYADTTKEVEDQNEKTKSLVDTLMQWSVTSKLIHSGLRLLKSAVKDVNETLADTEKRIIAIQRVLPEGSVSDKDLSNRLYDLAIEYGQSFQNVSDIATNFARTGLSYADTINATRAALLGMNVAELDVTQATDGLIAVMAQFELQASDLDNVIDKLNKTADRFPVTTEKLMSAIQRMGSSASLAGLGLDETIGVATALSKATGRSGANIGTAANALIQYSTKGKALDIYSQLSPEVAAIVEQYKIGAANVLDIWKALSKEIDRLTFEQSEKLDVLAEYFETGEGAGLKEQMEDELGDIFNDITGVFSTANTFRKNYFVALLKEMGTVEEAAETARDSMGYSIAENEKEMQTYQRRVQALEEHWHKLANDEQGFLAFRKGLVETGDILLNVVEWTGGLRTSALGLGTALMVAFGPKLIESTKEFVNNLKGANGQMSAFTGWVGLAITVVSALVGVMEKANAEQHEANLAAIEAWESNSKNAKELDDLYKKYLKLNPESEEFRTVEDRIVEILKDKNGVLSTLKTGTEEYTTAVKALTAAERENYVVSLGNAARAAEDELLGLSLNDESKYGSTKIGRTTHQGAAGAAADFYAATNTVQGRIALYLARKRIVDDYNERYLDLIRQGKVDEAKALFGESDYKHASAFVNDLEPYISRYFKLQSENYLNSYITANGDLHSKGDATEAYKYVLSQFSQSGITGLVEFGDVISGLIDSYIIGETKDNPQGGERTLQNIGSQYSKIAEAVSELLSSNQKVNEELEKQKALEEAIAKAKAEYIRDSFEAYLAGLETENTISEKQQSIDEVRKKIEEARLAVAEKRQAVKEAEYNLQKAQDDLEYAKRNRSERVFNAETGMWEYQANKKSVADAQEKVRAATEKVEDAVKNVDTSIKAVETAEKNVQKAVDALKDYLQKQAIAEIKTAINNGNISNEKVKDILVKWFGEDGGGTWGAGIQNAIATAIAGSGAAAASNSAVISAKEALATHIQDKFYTDVMSLFTAGGAVSQGDVDALIEKYRALGVSADAIAAIKKTINNVGNLDMWSNWSPASNGIRSYANKGIITGPGWGTSPVTPPVVAGGNTSNDNRTYTVNGVPIPAQAARSMTIEELFSNFELVR